MLLRTSIKTERLVAKLIADARDESVARARIYIPRVASAAFCQAQERAVAREAELRADAVEDRRVDQLLREGDDREGQGH